MQIKMQRKSHRMLQMRWLFDGPRCQLKNPKNMMWKRCQEMTQTQAHLVAQLWSSNHLVYNNNVLFNMYYNYNNKNKIMYLHFAYGMIKLTFTFSRTEPRMLNPVRKINIVWYLPISIGKKSINSRWLWSFVFNMLFSSIWIFSNSKTH